MVDIEVERSHKVDGDDYVAIKTSTWKNAAGKKVVQTVEEHNITPEEIESVIKVDGAADEEAAKVCAELKKLAEDIASVRAEHQETFDSAEYQEFKEMLKDEKYKRLFQALNTEREVVNFENRVKELEKTLSDIGAWRAQFGALRDEISRS